jgi:hypothetical protein
VSSILRSMNIFSNSHIFELRNNMTFEKQLIFNYRLRKKCMLLFYYFLYTQNFWKLFFVFFMVKFTQVNLKTKLLEAKLDKNELFS